MSLVLYGAPLSPFVRKADVFLREKGLEFELESVNIMPMPDWFKEISPARKIPVLRDKAVGEKGTHGTIPDSSAICGYLEKKAPDPPLYPADPYEYGRALWIEEFCDSDVVAIIGAGIFRPIQFARFQNKEPDVATAKKNYDEHLPRRFDHLEGEVEGREFVVGDAFGIADISIAVQLAQLELVAGPIDAERWPALAQYGKRIASRPSFAPCLEICRKIVTQEPVDLR